MINDVDQKLRNAGVKFLPWIGDHYECGFLGRKLLILLEAHYDYEGRVEEVPDVSELTRYIWKNKIDENNKDHSWWWKIGAAFTGISATDSANGFSFWHQVAAYNFIQEFPAGEGVYNRGRFAPRAKQFRESRRPFRELLEVLRPDAVVVLGSRLWNGMEPIPKSHQRSDYLQAYQLSDGSLVWCMATYHPSSGNKYFNLQTLTIQVRNFLESVKEL